MSYQAQWYEASEHFPHSIIKSTCHASETELEIQSKLTKSAWKRRILSALEHFKQPETNKYCQNFKFGALIFLHQLPRNQQHASWRKPLPRHTHVRTHVCNYASTYTCADRRANQKHNASGPSTGWVEAQNKCHRLLLLLLPLLLLVSIFV